MVEYVPSVKHNYNIIIANNYNGEQMKASLQDGLNVWCMLAIAASPCLLVRGGGRVTGELTSLHQDRDLTRWQR